MKLAQRWLLACIVTVVVLVIVRLEASERLSSNVRTIVSSSEDIVLLQRFVKRVIEREENTIAVSSAMHSQKLLAFVSAEKFGDGYLLTYHQPPIIQALQDGYIVFTGHTKKTGKTMTIHYGDMVVTYGMLDAFNKLPYTAVKYGELLALKGNDSPLYLRMEKGGQVLHLDEILPLLKEWQLQ